MGEVAPVTANPRALNLGCGLSKRADCINVDLRPAVDPDLVWDLAVRPYPLPRSYFDKIYAFDVVEHLEDIQSFIEETHALLIDGGILELTTPHFSCANSFTDPTHRHHLGYFSFDYFTNSSGSNFYSTVRYEIAERILVFRAGPISRCVATLARRWPALYERRLAWLWPAWFLIFRLRALKS